MKKVEVVPHDPRWRNAFEAEAKHVSTALGENVVAIHHIADVAPSIAQMSFANWSPFKEVFID